MTDLISRQAAIDAIRALPHLYGNKEQRARTGGLADAAMAIRDLPTIDAVPVVRCKDCRFSVVNENIDRKPLICGKTKMCGETTPDWFCAAGKRSEDGES